MKKIMNICSKVSVAFLFAVAAVVQPMSLFFWGTPEAPEELYK